MPPKVAWAAAPGSTEKNRPPSPKCSLSCWRVTPASIVASRSSALTRKIRFIWGRINADPAAQSSDVTLQRGAYQLKPPNLQHFLFLWREIEGLRQAKS